MGQRTHSLNGAKRESAVSCQYCGREFGTVRALRSHETKMHISGNWNMKTPLSCPVCGKQSSSRQGIKMHTMRVHDPDGISRYSDSGRKISKSQHKRFLNPDARKLESDSNKAAWSKLKSDEDFMSKFKNSVSEATKAALKRPEVRRHLLESQPSRALHRNSGWGIKSTVHEKSGRIVFCDSSYESRLCSIMNKDDRVISYNRCIAYFTVPGTGTRYNPDFYVIRDGLPDLIVEVKSDYTICHRMVPYKVESAIDYCRRYGVSYVVMSDSELDIYDMCINEVDRHRPDIEDLCMIRWDAR